MNMLNNEEILTSVLKTTQMGQVGIRSVLRSTMGPPLREDLENQLRAYDAIEAEAQCVASQRGWEMEDLDPALEFMADRMTRMKLLYRRTDSRIADMMIQGSTRGMVKSLRNLHRFRGSDSQVCALSQKLLDTETAGIRQMQPYL